MNFYDAPIGTKVKMIECGVLMASACAGCDPCLLGTVGYKTSATQAKFGKSTTDIEDDDKILVMYDDKFLEYKKRLLQQ